jgi:microcystin-dependent protein
MPARRYFANAAPQRTTAGSITSGAGTVSVSGTFGGWPTQFPFFAVFEYGGAAMEIVSVTNIAGSTATITRGQGGTPAVSHAAGVTFDFAFVAQDFDEANAHTSASSGVHGISGSLVGTSDAQTLSNKTLTSPTINSPTVSGGTFTGTATMAAVNTSGAVSVGGRLTGDGSVPSGAVTAFAGSSAPAGWLLCDGSAVSRTGANAALFAAVGTTFGSGDGSTTFNVPNLKQTFLRGADTGAGNTLGSTGGSAVATHFHNLSNNGQAKISFGTNVILGDFSPTNYSVTTKYQGSWSAGTASGTSLAIGLQGITDTASTSTVPPYLAMNFIIKL